VIYSFIGEEIVRMTHENAVNDVAFSPDGKYLAVASGDETRRWLWRQPEDLPDEACSRLTRNLTEEEWQQYLDGEPYRRTCPDITPVDNDPSSGGM
jgi:WD40 repeat protein